MKSVFTKLRKVPNTKIDILKRFLVTRVKKQENEYSGF